MKLRASRKAGSQIRAIGRFIAADNPSAAARVVAAISEACELLVDFPEIGQRVGRGTEREWMVRGLPYVLVYQIEAARNELVLLAVYHTSQNRPLD